jgi:hypothetical protein
MRDTRSGKAYDPKSTVKRSMSPSRIQRPSAQVSMQCMQGEDDGKYYYVALDPYNASHLEIIRVSPLLVNPTPDKFEKGALYTYIIASIITKNPGTGSDVQLTPPKLYACKAQNIFEFGTKHHHIFYRMALTPELYDVAQQNAIELNKVEYALYVSGEIRCIKPTDLMFNFFSGTYKMQRVIPANRVGYEEKFVTGIMKSIHSRYTISFKYQAFITSGTVPVTRDQLTFFNQHGIATFAFDTRVGCNRMHSRVLRFKNIEKREMSTDELRQAYEAETTVPTHTTHSVVAAPSTSWFSLPYIGSAIGSAASAVYSKLQSYAGYPNPTQQPAPVQRMPLHAMTMSELVELARQLNVSIPRGADRSAIINRLESLGRRGGRGKKRTTHKPRTRNNKQKKSSRSSSRSDKRSRRSLR